MNLGASCIRPCFLTNSNVRFTGSLSISLSDHSFLEIKCQLCLYFSPYKTIMAIHMFLKTGFQCAE